MLMISVLLAAGAFWSGLIGRGRWAVAVSRGLWLCLGPFLAWSVVTMAGVLVAAASTFLPAPTGSRPELVVMGLSAAPLLALGAGAWVRRLRFQQRLARLDDANVMTFIAEVERLAANPGLAQDKWLRGRWMGMSGREKLAWAVQRAPSLRALHRESGALGFSRLGQRAVDRLAALDRTNDTD